MSRRYSPEEFDELTEKVASYASELTDELLNIGVQANYEIRTSGWEDVWIVVEFFATSSSFNIVVDSSKNYTFNYPNLAEVGDSNSIEFESLDKLIDYIEEHYT